MAIFREVSGGSKAVTIHLHVSVDTACLKKGRVPGSGYIRSWCFFFLIHIRFASILPHHHLPFSIWKSISTGVTGVQDLGTTGGAAVGCATGSMPCTICIPTRASPSMSSWTGSVVDAAGSTGRIPQTLILSSSKWPRGIWIKVWYLRMYIIYYTYVYMEYIYIYIIHILVYTILRRTYVWNNSHNAVIRVFFSANASMHGSSTQRRP